MCVRIIPGELCGHAVDIPEAVADWEEASATGLPVPLDGGVTNQQTTPDISQD